MSIDISSAQSIFNHIVNSISPLLDREDISLTEKSIIQVGLSTVDLLLYKNKKYGDSALHPINVFNKQNAQDSIGSRLDDKLSRLIENSDLTKKEKKTFVKLFSRVMGGSKLRKNDVSDMIGYLILLCCSMKWTTFEEFKD